MSKYIYPLTKEVAMHVASNLRPDDYREVTEGHGHNPFYSLLTGASVGHFRSLVTPDNKGCSLWYWS